MQQLKKLFWSALDFARSVGWYFSTAWTASRSAKLSVVRLLIEQGLLFALHGVDARTYFTYRLFDRHISWDDKRTYLPTDKSRRAKTIMGLFTPRRYIDIYRNKVMFNHVFTPLRQARICAVYNLYGENPLKIESLPDEAALDHWMRTTDVTEVACKPVYGEKGMHVLIFAGRAPDDPGTFVTLAGERYDARKLATLTGDQPMLFQHRIRQHPELTAWLGQTVCCVRVVTWIGDDKKARLMGAVFKIQASPVGVDHLIYGAVGAWVDLDTGRLNRGRTRYSMEYTWEVPGTGESFEGRHLPCWEAVKEMAEMAAEGITDARAVGWDIAISDQGPVMVEGNDYWSLELIQLPAPKGLLCGEFKALVEELQRLKAIEQAKLNAVRLPT